MIEFIFVENSGDPKVENHASRLKSKGFATKVIYTENDGFGSGCNVGARAASGDILIFANPDICFLSDLSHALSGFRRYSWGTVRQLSDKNTVYAFDLLPEYRNIMTEVLRAHRFLHILPLIRRFVYPVGSFMFVKKDLFEASGGFNERFFLYFEEAELSRRLARLAGTAGYLAEVSIWHKGLGTQPSNAFAFAEDARGFLKYCEVTNQKKLIKKRMKTLRLLSFFSETARIRAKILENEIKGQKS